MLAIVNTTEPDFTKENLQEWIDLRNDVFHGRRIPDRQFLTELVGVSERIWNAVETVAVDRLRCQPAARRPLRMLPALYETYTSYFVEFDTGETGEEFPTQVPNVKRLTEIIEGHGHIQQEMNCTLLNPEEFMRHF